MSKSSETFRDSLKIKSLNRWQVARIDGDETTFNELFNLKADAQRFYDAKIQQFEITNEI